MDIFFSDYLCLPFLPFTGRDGRDKKKDENHEQPDNPAQRWDHWEGAGPCQRSAGAQALREGQWDPKGKDTTEFYESTLLCKNIVFFYMSSSRGKEGTFRQIVKAFGWKNVQP